MSGAQQRIHQGEIAVNLRDNLLQEYKAAIKEEEEKELRKQWFLENAQKETGTIERAPVLVALVYELFGKSASEYDIVTRWPVVEVGDLVFQVDNFPDFGSRALYEEGGVKWFLRYQAKCPSCGTLLRPLRPNGDPVYDIDDLKKLLLEESKHLCGNPCKKEEGQ